MALELYGLRLSGNEQLLPLREVTFCIDSSQAQALSEFFARCAREMESNPRWDHEHFVGGNIPDVIVACSAGTHGKD